MSDLLYNKCATEFIKQAFKKVLSREHVDGGQVKFNKLELTDGGEDENFWGYVLQKDNKKYLLSAVSKDGKEIDIYRELPIIVKAKEKVAYRGIVYWIIRDYASVAFNSEKKMSFRQLVDTLSDFKHTNPDHYKLLVFIVLCQLFGKMNARVVSPKGFGKTSAVNGLRNLGQKTGTVSNPSRANLEQLISQSIIYIDEVVDIDTSIRSQISAFLLAATDDSEAVQKQTLSDFKAVLLDLSDTSFGMFYNDIDHYRHVKKPYFDFYYNKALLDRFVPFRLYGEFTEQYHHLKGTDISSFVESNEQFYKDLINSLMYYKENKLKYVHGFDRDQSRLDKYSNRWQGHIIELLLVIDAYCESQEEFDRWQDIVFGSVEDYSTMLSYPSYYEELTKKLDSGQLEKVDKALMKTNPFSAKIELLKQLGKNPKKSESFAKKQSHKTEWWEQ